MKLIRNGKICNEADLKFSFLERAFQYGDGLFETIIARNYQMPLLAYHIERMVEGMKVMGLTASSDFTHQQIQTYILELMAANSYAGTARIKWMIWRSQGGLYLPKDNTIQSILYLQPFIEPDSRPLVHVAFSEKVTLSYSLTSALKTMQCLPYIMAALEKQERRLDELILTDNNGNIAECTAANIFWVRENRFFTPALSTGCISGVMRRHIMKICQNHPKYKVEELRADKAALMKAETVFCCNVTGIRKIGAIGAHHFPNSTDLSFLTL